MKKYTWIRLVLAAVFVLNLSACGGSGGGGSTPPAKGITLAGVVEDGPVAKATVYAQRKDGTGKVYGPCVTDEQGRFTLSVDAGVDLAGLMLFARGGKDGTTGPRGLDFKGMVMMAPLAMFAQKTGAVVVSPVTTLVGLKMEKGDAYKLACTTVAGTLKVAENKLGSRPSVEGGAFHAKTMMLSLVATTLQAEGGEGSAYGRVVFTAEGKPETGGIEGLADAVAAIEEAVAHGEAPGEVFVRARLLKAIVAILDANSPSSEDDEPVFKANARVLVNDIFKASGDVPINLAGMAPERIVRRVLSLSGVPTYDAFMASKFPTVTAWVKDDKGIATIAKSVVAMYEVGEPLFDEELLGDDNFKRVNYYFNSNASHLHKAEKLIGTVLDDTVNDDIMTRVAWGTAEAGFFTEAETILETQVFSTYARARGFVELGKKALKYSRLSDKVSHEEAVAFMEKAEALAKKKIEAVGKVFFDQEDAYMLQLVARLYSDAGESKKADDLHVYATDCLNAMGEFNTGPLGNIAVSLRDTAKNFIEAGNEADAASLPGTMFELAKRIPARDAENPDYPKKDDDPDIVDYYKRRVYFLTETVGVYGALYDSFGGVIYKTKALEVYAAIKELRDTYPFTAEMTGLYMARIVAPVLFDMGETAKAQVLTEAADYFDMKYIYAAQATSKALGGKDMKAAFDIVDLITNEELKKQVRARVKALTRNDSVKGRRNIAARLIDAGVDRYADAVLALEKAEGLLDGFTSDDNETIYYTKVYRGYVKLAHFYGLMEKATERAEMLDKATHVANAMDGDIWKVQALCKTAAGWQAAGEEARMTQCMNAARNLADSVTVGGGVKHKDMAALYCELMRGYMALNLRGQIRETANILAAGSVPLFDESFTKEEWDALGGTAHDDALTLRGTSLYYAADALIGSGQNAEAMAALDKAIATKDAYYDDNEAVELCIGEKGNTFDGLVKMYARADAVDKALEMSKALGSSAEINKGIKWIASVLSGRDRFSQKSSYGPEKPEYWVAWVDTDGDGAPDFFHPLATADDIIASGLTLDHDSDGDGIPDTEDTRPLYAQ